MGKNKSCGRRGCGRGQSLFCAKGFSPRSRREFYSAISHVFRGPMVGATGYIDYLFKGYSGPLSSDQLVQLGRARDSLLQLTSAVNAFLDLVSFDLGLAGLRLRKTDLAAVVAEAAVRLRYLAHKKKIKISFVSPDKKTFIKADQEWLKTMLTELLSGVLLLSPEKSQVTLQLAGVGRRVQLLLVNSCQREEVKSSQFLFKPFSFEPVVGGAGGRRGGLGLSLAYRIAVAHEAKVKAYTGSSGYLEIRLNMPGA